MIAQTVSSLAPSTQQPPHPCSTSQDPCGYFCCAVGECRCPPPPSAGLHCNLSIDHRSGFRKELQVRPPPHRDLTWSSRAEPEINGQVPSVLGSVRGPQVFAGGHGGTDAHRERCSWDPVSLPWLHPRAWGGRTLSPLTSRRLMAPSSEIPSSGAFSQVGWLSLHCSRGLLDNHTGLSLGVQQSAELGNREGRDTTQAPILPVFPGAYMGLYWEEREAEGDLLDLEVNSECHLPTHILRGCIGAGRLDQRF